MAKRARENTVADDVLGSIPSADMKTLVRLMKRGKTKSAYRLVDAVLRDREEDEAWSQDLLDDVLTTGLTTLLGQ